MQRHEEVWRTGKNEADMPNAAVPKCKYMLLKEAMSQIAALLGHHSFGDKNSLERQKNLLIKRVNRGLPAPNKYIPHQIVIKLTSSSSKLSSHQQATNTKTTNSLIFLPPGFSLISDSESKIKKYA